MTHRQGYAGAGTSVDYSVFDPFDSSSYFHSYCLISNYDNQTNVEDCWLGDTTVSLPDLNTDLTSVQTIWYDWVADLVSNYSSMHLLGVCCLTANMNQLTGCELTLSNMFKNHFGPTTMMLQASIVSVKSLMGTQPILVHTRTTWMVF